jgi:hypothetical protein
MPGVHCPLCGAVRAAGGCGCASSHPDVTETAVLPHIEGPPLVRPYVPAAATDHRPGPATPFQDPFATALMPQAPQAPPMPPRPPGRPPAAAPGHPEAGGDLGVFSFQGTAPQRPGGRAERREHQQLAAGRRRTAVVVAGLGIAAVGAGLAFVLAPSPDGGGPDQALPAPTGSVEAPPSVDVTAPTGEASSSGRPKASATATRSRTPASRAPVGVVSATGPAAPSASAPAAASPTPSAPATFRVLQAGDSGADVRTMQQLLLTADCGDHNLNTWFVSGTFDSWTQWVLADFQRQHRIKGDERNGTLYGPQTRAALQATAADPGC